MGRFETAAPANLSALADLSGHWIESRARPPPPARYRARHGFKRKPDARRAGDERLERPLCLCLRSSISGRGHVRRGIVGIPRTRRCTRLERDGGRERRSARSKLRKSHFERARVAPEVDKYLAQKDQGFVANEPQSQHAGARWKRLPMRVRDTRCPPTMSFPADPGKDSD
jgi:hypothetical protein